MSLRSGLILASVLANLFLIYFVQGAARRVKEARQLSLLEDTDLNKVRELSGRVKPSAGLNPAAVSQDLAILLRVKSAVAEQLNSGRGGRADLKCPFASRGELDQMLAQMQDYGKRVDQAVSGAKRDSADKDAMVRAVEQEAAKLKLELISLCAR